MPKITIGLCLILVVLAMSAATAAEPVLKRPYHPRLEMTPQQLQAARVDASQVAAARAAGDAALKMDRTGGYKEYYIPLPAAPFPPPHKDKAWPYWTGLCSSLRTYISNLALAYALTGDRKYYQPCLTATLSVCRNWPQWTDPDYGTQPCLDTHSLVRGVCYVYDMLYHDLSAQDRETIHHAIATKGAEFIYKAGQDPKSYVSQPNAWPNGFAVVNTALGVAGLTLLGEDPNAPRWIEQATAKATEYFNQQGGKDGGLLEGFGYGSFAVDNFIYLVEKAQLIAGIDLFSQPYLSQAIYFPAYSILPNAPLLAAIGDNGNTDGCPATLLATAKAEVEVRHDPLAAWYLVRAGQASPQAEALAREPDDLPLAREFRSIRWAMLRTGWTPDDAVMVFKSGFPNHHNHLDQNHFVLGYGSQWVINDPGYEIYDIAYPPEKHWSRQQIHNMHVYTAESEGHNTLLVNGQGQLAKAGHLTGFFSSHALGYVEGDATACYAGRLTNYLRQVFNLPRRYYLVWDHARAATPRQIDMLLHTTPDGKFVVAGKELATGQTTKQPALVIRRETAQVAVDLLAPAGLITTACVWPDSQQYGHYISISPSDKMTNFDAVTMLRPGPVGQVSPVIAHLLTGAADSQAMAVDLDGIHDTIVLQPTAGALDEVSGSGQAGVVGRRGNDCVRYALLKGERLALAGRPLVEADQPLSVGVLIKPGYWRADIQTTGAGKVTLYCPVKPGLVSFSGLHQSTEVAFDETHQTLQLPLQPGRYSITVRSL